MAKRSKKELFFWATGSYLEESPRMEGKIIAKSKLGSFVEIGDASYCNSPYFKACFSSS